MSRNDEEELKILFQEISAIISRNIHNVTGEKKKQLLNRAEDYVAEAEEIVSKMKAEAKNENNNEINIKIKNAKNNIIRFKSLLNQEKQNIRVNERTQLLGDSSENIDYSITDMDQRTRLLYNTQRIYNMNSRFEDTQRLAEEAEAMGSDTLQLLHQQRQQLMGINNNLNETNDEIGNSGRYLVQIQHNQKILKLLLIVLVLVIIIIVGAAVYLKISKLLK
ncbi:hypothetical protein BCR36DRAFT_412250 [Piromyces finnis]|uniref:Vesicle transport v-SNARE N-terminal domain-containing protein n=1 Tax=Piromyces finnis TaxID=1754191 RepID=A0A1Y1VB68_9FUNG|nr:hypothetical protein BCR36DRAFT_412250 [Piromyces finnis]|eukprot:ORX50757.1 hypothetical protein BCR36DRAFT_412250 [Piromyces finnis]